MIHTFNHHHHFKDILKISHNAQNMFISATLVKRSFCSETFLIYRVYIIHENCRQDMLYQVLYDIHYFAISSIMIKEIIIILYNYNLFLYSTSHVLKRFK